MEKADILEMTVKHLKERNSTSTSDVLDRYRAGYMACLQTTLDYLGNHSDLSKDVQMNLAQAISCRMLQYKKCEVIPSKSPLETNRPRVYSEGSYNNALLSNQRTLTHDATNRIHGYQNTFRSASHFETSNYGVNHETNLPGIRRDRRSSSVTFARASPDFLSQNEDSGFADDNVFCDFNNQCFNTSPAYSTNSNGSASSDNVFFQFSNNVSRTDSCSSEVWRPW
ncbi:hypothetical protein FSP39_001576 [Pinctada imbricata]|uniref:Orange domain-containing protein n=1 Tax=Pinctada imbricata TaxID=66713 RepID=A0AA88XJT9_PINIB|nr:hypothetical protein FSP39_001576 [Pinctada imbricata]